MEALLRNSEHRKHFVTGSEAKLLIRDILEFTLRGNWTIERQFISLIMPYFMGLGSDGNEKVVLVERADYVARREEKVDQNE